MKKKQVEYLAEARLQKIRSYILQVIGVGIIVYCSFHFPENPILISIVILFILLMIMMPGHDMVIVYSEGIEFVAQHSWIDLFSRRWYFSFEDVQSIDVNLQLTRKGFIISEIIGSGILTLSQWNTVIIKLRDGHEKTIYTKVYKSDILNALIIVKRTSKNKIVITGE